MRFALGFENGTVSIKDKDNDKDIKTIQLDEDRQERISCMAFSGTRFLNKDYVLYVGTWEKNIYLVELFNFSVIDVKKLSADPLCITIFRDDYVMVGTNNNEISMFTKEGAFISNFSEGITDWALAVKANNKYSSFITCTNDGKILNNQINFQVVHAIYNEKYVYRHNLMEIIIHDLMQGSKTKIKCKKFIRKIAVYKSMIAALTSDKVYVYQEEKVPKYFIKWEGDVNLMLLTSNNLLICVDNHLYMYPLTNAVPLISKTEREWSFDSDIKYLRVLGGAKKREALICGLKNGEVYMIYIDNQFPVLLYQHDVPIRSLDMKGKKLAIVDDNFDLQVIDTASKSILMSNVKAKSIAFNSDLDNMIAYWYDGSVYIKTAEFAPISEKMNGVIIGFRGTKVFVLQSGNSVNVLDISHSTSIMQYSEKKNFPDSFKVACLGATNQEWLYLGFESLLNFDFVVAVNSFKKLQDIRLINLVFRIEQDRKDGVNDDVLRGDILAHMGRYKEAADAYIKGGHPEKAQEMYAILKMYAEAMNIKNKYMTNSDVTDEILLQQAEWLNENGKYKEAADLFWSLGRKKRAIEIYGERGMLEKLIEICRKEDVYELIALCGYYFKLHKHVPYATEAYLKLGDIKALVMMNVELEKWEEAFILAQQHKTLLEYVYLQYADFLIKQDKYKEAQEAYKSAGRIDLSMKLLTKLINNAVYEKRFKDACYLLLQHSNDALHLIKDYKNLTAKDKEYLVEYQMSLDLADIYNAYDSVYKFIEEPFSNDLLTIDHTGLFNTCRFLVNKISVLTDTKRNNFSPAYIYYALAFLAKEFEAYKTARFTFEKLSLMNFPPKWQSKIDLEIVLIRTKPYTDKETSLPMCYRCLHTNPLLNIKGDKCTICSNPFIRSPITYEILPLIEFKPVNEVNDDMAIEIIKSNALNKLKANNSSENTIHNEEVNTLVFDEQQNDDLFGMKLVEITENAGDEYSVLVIDEDILRTLNESEVFIIDLRLQCSNYPVRFFKNRMKDVFITMCKFCYHFFRTEEFENLFLKNGKVCPICRMSDEILKK